MLLKDFSEAMYQDFAEVCRKNIENHHNFGSMLHASFYQLLGNPRLYVWLGIPFRQYDVRTFN
jgi:hypothetical protein